MRYFVIFLVIGLFLTACDESDAQKKQDNDHETVYQKEPCQNQNIIVVLDDVEISVPRTAYIRLGSGESFNNLEFRQCDLKKISNVYNARWAEPEEFQFIKSGIGRTTYQSYQFAIEEASQNHTVEELPDGIQKISLRNSELYILPSNKAITPNREPVVFECDKIVPELINLNYCRTSYENPAGFKFSYKISRKDYKPEELLELDQYKRAEISKMIISMPNRGK